MDELEIERHIVRAVYELELIKDEYDCHKSKDKIEKLEYIDNTIEMLLHYYPNVKEELEKETWI